jgi:C-terminal processing protease CtpA/Prc
VFEFSDGLFITDAIDSDLVGASIVGLAGQPIADVLALIEPLVPRDSPATVPLFRPLFLLRADVLQGLGLIDDDASVALTISRPGTNASPMEIVVETVPFDRYQVFAGDLGVIHLPTRAGFRYLAPIETDLSSELLGSGTLYAQLDEVQVPSQASLDLLTAQLQDPSLEKVVFDLRHNPGGNNFTYPELLELLQTIEVPLFVMIDRATFSAASNLATEVEQSSEAVFAGEEMGGGLNFWNDVTFVPLRNLPIPLRVGVSTRYWEKSYPEDPRLTITPDLVVPYSATDFFGGIDRALEAVLVTD